MYPVPSIIRGCFGPAKRLWWAWAVYVLVSCGGFAAGTDYVFNHLAGATTGPGRADGKGRYAHFLGPAAVTVDASSNVYVADAGNCTIRKVAPDGTVTTLAGVPGVPGADDGPDGRFENPVALALDRAGNLFVADLDNHSIREVTPDGTISTFAGKNGVDGTDDGIGQAARFREPTALAFDSRGNLFVVDHASNSIRKITADGTVTTFAGKYGAPLSVDGVGTEAQFDKPTALAIDREDNLFVLEWESGYIRKVTPDAVVSTVVPNYYPNRFFYAYGLAVDAADNLYVADTGRSIIQKMIPGQGPTVFAGTKDIAGTVSGPRAIAQFNWPTGLAIGPTGDIYVADTNNDRIQKIDASGAVTTLAGSALSPGYMDGAGAWARFNSANDLGVDDKGNLYVPEYRKGAVRKVTPDGVVSTLAGTPGNFGYRDGSGRVAQFMILSSIAVDGRGNCYLADTGNEVVRKIASDGEVSTLAGSPGKSGYADGTGAAARFYSPQATAVDRDGIVYVADDGNHVIRKITPDGTVTTLAGGGLGAADKDGVGRDAVLDVITHLASDAEGNIYATEPLSCVVRKITPDGVVTTFAGKRGQVGFVDGTGPEARFSALQGITSGPDGIYVIDYDTVRRIAPDGTVTTLAGSPGELMEVDGRSDKARFFYASGVAVDAAGNIYVSEYGGHSIRKGTRIAQTAPAIVWSPPDAIVRGTPISALQLSATADIPGAFIYDPATGAVLDTGPHFLSTVLTSDSDPGAPIAAQVALQVLPSGFAGTYIGKFGDYGNWALRVNPDQSGLFVGYGKSDSSVIAVDVTVDASGVFKSPGAEVLANKSTAATLTGSIRTPLAAMAVSDFAVLGQIAFDRSVSGRVLGFDEAFNGALDGEPGPPPPYYSGSLIGGTEAQIQAIVSPNGRCVVVVDGPTSGSASGWLDPGGKMNTILDGGANLALSLSPTAGTLNADLGDEPLHFVGLASNVVPNKRLMNLSTRALGGAGDNVSIGGFVVAGTGTKRVLIRAVGPSLVAQGIAESEAMADPTIEIHDALHGNKVTATNDNWVDNANSAEIAAVSSQIGATALSPDDTKSSALLLSLAPGVYSFVANGKSNTTGIVLLEIYDADASNPAAALVNISARARVAPGNGVTIGGFVVSGNAPKRLLVRAVGPSLATQGLPADEVLVDPTITVHDALHGNVVIASNDNWGDNDNAPEIVATGARVGATPLTADDTTSAGMVLIVPPGVYSIVATGKAGASGIVLVEIYDAD